MIAIAALPLLLLIAVLVLPGQVRGADDCDRDEVEIGIVKATGCFKARTPTGQAAVYDVSGKFRMNGFDVQPTGGTTVTFAPASSGRGASVTTNNGFVDLSADHPTFGTIHFNNMNFAFAPPNKGEIVLSESALAQPWISIAGLSPVGVKQPISLTEDGASFDLSFSAGNILEKLITSSDKQISFGVGFEVADGKYKIAEGKFGLGSFELANLLAINEAELEFGANKVDATLDATFKAIAKFGLIGGFSYEDGHLKSVTVGASELDKPLGTSGIFLQKLAFSVFTAPPYGGSGTIGLSAGPKTDFFGHEVTAVDADGTVEVRGADPGKAPPYFKVNGNMSLVTIPVANANFAYYFGQGTQFAINFGIGLPSATNDPGQPSYIGGGFSGWTTAQHFDLEGNAKLKLLGIDLLGAQAVLSDYGFAGCLQVGLWVGGGVRWSDGRGELLGGFTCNIGGYKRQRAATLRAAERGRTRVRLDEGEKVIRILAKDGEEAPDVSIEGEDGSVLRTPADGDEDGIRKFPGGASMSNEEGMSAFILRDGSAADWQLTELPGSTSVETIETAGELPAHRVRARITGKGRKKTLHWHSRRIPHQTLQFSERLPDGREVLIHTTRKPNGKVRFRPVEGAGAYNVKRKLAVDVMQRLNTPRDELVADAYRVRRQPAPHRVRHLRVERRLGDVVVTWRRSKGAKGYEVSAKALGAGASYRVEVGAHRNRARLTVGTTKRMRVAVVPRNAQGRRAPATVRTIDTEKLVRGKREAVRRLVRGAYVARGGRLISNPACPDDGSCTGRLLVAKGGRVLGRARFELPPDMTDRVVVRLRPAVRRKLERGKVLRRIRVSGRISQLDGSAPYAQKRSLRAR